MTTIKIVLRKDKINAANEAPLHFRITRNRKVSYITTGVRIEPHNWDDRNKSVRKNVANAARLNALLSKRFAELQEVIITQETSNPVGLSSKKLKKIINGETDLEFFSFANDFIEAYRSKDQYGTYDRVKTVIRKLETYNQGKPLLFSDITPDFLYRYETYLRSKLKNRTNTIHSNLKFVRRLFNAAYERDLIEHHQNPFLKYKLKAERTGKQFLTESEIATIEQLNLKNRQLLQKAQQMFVFACYAGGLRVSDLLLLKWENFTGTHLHFRIKKTGNQHSIKIPNKALEILMHLKSLLTNKRYIFNFLPEDLDERDARSVDLSISRCTAAYNRSLQAIAALASISKPVSSHGSRYFFGTHALRKGISLDKVQHILSHHSPAVTQIYAKLVNDEVDKAMDLLN